MGNAVTPNGSGITDAERTAISALGTISSQNANAVAITGGTVTGATVGGITPAQQDLVANGAKATVSLTTVATPYAGTEELSGVPGMATKTVTEMGGAAAIAAYVTANSACDCTLVGTALTLTAKAYGDSLNGTRIYGDLLSAEGELFGGKPAADDAMVDEVHQESLTVIHDDKSGAGEVVIHMGVRGKWRNDFKTTGRYCAYFGGGVTADGEVTGTRGNPGVMTNGPMICSGYGVATETSEAAVWMPPNGGMITGVPDITEPSFCSFRTDADQYPHFDAWECPGGVVANKIKVGGLENGGRFYGRNIPMLADAVKTVAAGGEHSFDFTDLVDTEFLLDFTCTPSVADLYEVILQPNLTTPATVKVRRVYADASDYIKLAAEMTAYIAVANQSASGAIRCRVHLWQDENAGWQFESEAYKPGTGAWEGWQHHRGYFSGTMTSLRVNCSTDVNVKFTEGSTFRLIGWSPYLVERP